MNMTQGRVTLQYLATALAAYIAGKGWLPDDVALEVATLLVGLIPALIGVWKSRDKGKLEAAAKVKGVTIVAPDDVARATPAENIVPSSENEVVKK